MMDIKWLNEQIEHEIARGNNPSAVRDLASLVIAQMYVSGDLARLAGGDDVRQYGRRYGTDMQHTYAHDDGTKHLTKEQAEHWVQQMHGADGSHGGRWTWNEIRQYAANFGISGEQKMIEFYAIINAMASDYGKVAKKYGVDKADFYADLAKAWLDDKDAVPGKAMVYYDCIVEKEE